MLTRYRYFLAIVEHGGLTAAAEALGVSQPAITRSLKSLETQVGATLLERGRGRSHLTPEGEMLLPRARTLLAEQRSLLEDIASLRENGDTVTCINGSPMTAIALIPRILVRMADSHPDMRVSVRGDNGANYQWKRDALLAGELDVALTIADPMLDEAGLVQEPLFTPTLNVVVGRAHPGIDANADLDSLLGERWILPPLGSSPRAMVENEFRVRDLEPPRDSIEISDWRIALDLVHEARYVTAIPWHPSCFDDRFERFLVLPVEFSVRPLGICLVTRALGRERAATAAVVAIAREVVAERSA